MALLVAVGWQFWLRWTGTKNLRLTNLEGLDLQTGDLEQLLTIDAARWTEEMKHRSEHLEQFSNLPEVIRAAHARITSEFEQNLLKGS